MATEKKDRLGLRINHDINLKLRMIAQEIGISKNALISHIFNDYCKRYQKKEGD